MLTRDLQLVNDVLHSGQKSAAKEEAQLAFERIRRFCENSIALRLDRVEADLALLRRAHAPVRTRLERCKGCGAYFRADCDLCQQKLRAEAFEVMPPAEQDAASWAKIEAWHPHEYPHAVCSISIEGPFSTAPNDNNGRPFYYARLQGGHGWRGNTRSDALAHAAQWCENELTQIQGAPRCAICHKRKHDHEGADHTFTYLKAAPAASVIDDTCAKCHGRLRDHDTADHIFVKEITP